MNPIKSSTSEHQRFVVRNIRFYIQDINHLFQMVYDMIYTPYLCCWIKHVTLRYIIINSIIPPSVLELSMTCDHVNIFVFHFKQHCTMIMTSRMLTMVDVLCMPISRRKVLRSRWHCVQEMSAKDMCILLLQTMYSSEYNYKVANWMKHCDSSLILKVIFSSNMKSYMPPDEWYHVVVDVAFCRNFISYLMIMICNIWQTRSIDIKANVQLIAYVYHTSLHAYIQTDFKKRHTN